MSEIYSEYWKRKDLLKSKVPQFEVLEYYQGLSLSPIEQRYLTHLKNAKSILDFGAGDLSTMRKFQAAGVRALYETLDVAGGISYNYRTIDEIKRKYDVILFLDVLEHLPLNDGLSILNQLTQLLNENGVLIIQTPNARCVRNPLSWDMTHVQCYNAPDLWTYLSCLNLQVNGFRVVFSSFKKTLGFRLRSLISKIIITKFLGMDYADNIVMICRRQG